MEVRFKESIKVENTKNENVVKVTMVITKGKLEALKNGMERYGEAGSAVGFDVFCMLRNAATLHSVQNLNPDDNCQF